MGLSRWRIPQACRAKRRRLGTFGRPISYHYSVYIGTIPLSPLNSLDLLVDGSLGTNGRATGLEDNFDVSLI